MNCEVCNDKRADNEHHLIPKAVSKKRSPPHNKLRKKKINVCFDCHEAIHTVMLTHLAMERTYNNFSKFDAVLYQVMKAYFKNTNKKAYTAWRQYRKKMFQRLVVEMMVEDSKKYVPQGEELFDELKIDYMR